MRKLVASILTLVGIGGLLYSFNFYQIPTQYQLPPPIPLWEKASYLLFCFLIIWGLRNAFGWLQKISAIAFWLGAMGSIIIGLLGLEKGVDHWPTASISNPHMIPLDTISGTSFIIIGLMIIIFVIWITPRSWGCRWTMHRNIYRVLGLGLGWLSVWTMIEYWYLIEALGNELTKPLYRASVSIDRNVLKKSGICIITSLILIIWSILWTFVVPDTLRSKENGYF